MTYVIYLKERQVYHEYSMSVFGHYFSLYLYIINACSISIYNTMIILYNNLYCKCNVNYNNVMIIIDVYFNL